MGSTRIAPNKECVRKNVLNNVLIFVKKKNNVLIVSLRFVPNFLLYLFIFSDLNQIQA